MQGYPEGADKHSDCKMAVAAAVAGVAAAVVVVDDGWGEGVVEVALGAGVVVATLVEERSAQECHMDPARPWEEVH